jgi:hypothetical protein
MLTVYELLGSREPTLEAVLPYSTSTQTNSVAPGWSQDVNKSVLFTDNYQPYGQDNQSAGSETYTFTGKPYSTATRLYYNFP